MDLGLLDEAIQVMRELTSELRLTDEDGELFMNVLMKTNLPALPAIDETGHTQASLTPMCESGTTMRARRPEPSHIP